VSEEILLKKIKARIKRFLKLLFRKLGISDRDQSLIRELGLTSFKTTISLMSKSRSQLRQDLFVIFELKGKKVGGGGYFVDFGATNGIDY